MVRFQVKPHWPKSRPDFAICDTVPARLCPVGQRAEIYRQGGAGVVMPDRSQKANHFSTAGPGWLHNLGYLKTSDIVEVTATLRMEAKNISNMDTQRIKSWLIENFGDKFMAYVQALRFFYLLKINPSRREPELAIIHRFLTKGDIVIDIGANGADWTYYLHQCIGAEGYIFAFEADPYYALATDIAIKLMRLKNVRLFPFGLSDIDEWVPIRVTDPRGLRFSGQSHIDKNACKNGHGVRVVQLKRLDSMLQEYPQLLNTTLIKCDVEGYELFVFEGANNIIAKARPFIILEIGNYCKQGYSAHDIYNFITKNDYTSFAMVGENTLSITGTMLENHRAISVNRIMIPNEKLNAIMDLVQSPCHNAS